MKKKIIIIGSMIPILIIGIISYIAFNKSINIENEKISEKSIDIIYEKLKDKKLKDDSTIIISISDSKNKAKVIVNKSNKLNDTFNKVKKETQEFISKSDYDAKWIKIEAIDFEKEIKVEQLEEDLENVHDNSYRRGIIIPGDPDVVLTEAEINSNGIIDYKNKGIDINKMNSYIKERDNIEIKSIPNIIKSFTTIGYFCDEKNNIYEICNNYAYTGRRIVENLNKDETSKIVDSASDYLLGMLKENGQFEYVYYPISEKESDTYNILRHAGSIWSLMVCKNNLDESKIKKAIEFMNSSIIEKDGETSYIEEEKSDEIKLGGNALSAIALCEYTSKYNNDEYTDTIKKLGNGIISMQKDDGGYNHTLNTNDFSVKDEYRTVYYDGEATLALLKIYSISKDEKYLNHAQKSIDYFIKNDYIKYCDHWISYATNEIANYSDNEKYYEFGLNNVSENLNTIEGKEITSHINFEMLLQCLELYNKGKEKFDKSDMIKNFPYERLISTIKERANFQLNSFMYPEIAMYFNTPNKYVNSFFIRQNNFRIRIDDIQHSILGYNNYLKNYEELT